MPEDQTSAFTTDDANTHRPGTLSNEVLLDALKMILTGTSLVDVLVSIARLIEGHSNGIICSIFLVQPDGVHMRYAAAPDLPEVYRNVTDGAVIGGRGPCGRVHTDENPFLSPIVLPIELSAFREKPFVRTARRMVPPDHWAGRTCAWHLWYVLP